MHFRSITFCLASLLFVSISHAQLFPGDAKNVEAHLISAKSTIKAGEPFTLALKLKISPTWHTYWINPGDAGKPPSLKLDLPPGFTATGLRFPIPEKIIVEYTPEFKQASLGYEHLVIHPLTITPPASLKVGDSFEIKGHSEWVMCDSNTCIPGKADISITLQVGEASVPSPDAKAIDETLNNLPKNVIWKTSISEKDKSLEITIELPTGNNLPEGKMKFHPANTNVFDLLQEPTISREGNTITVTSPKHEALKKLPDSFSGLLEIESGGKKTGFLVSTDEAAIIVDKLPEVKPESVTVGKESLPFGGGLAGILLAAFLGGIILNVMPCVFPVISLKIMSFISQAGEDKKKILMHSLVFALGILAFFWILTAMLLIMRSAGNADVGWGAQMRYPVYVLGLIIVMVMVALSLFGVVEFGTNLTGVGGNLANKSGYAGSFWSGALAVLLATPCTAPFMAPAIGFAISQPALVMIAIFTAIALGLAAPYIALATFPKWLDMIPPPGAWMDTFKQAMGFPMLAVAIWLIGVLSKQLNTGGLQWALGAVLLIAIATWILGRFVRLESSKSSRIKGKIAALVIFATGLLVAFYAKADRVPPSEINIKDVIAEHRKSGKNVFVDFTADWCLTCKANEAGAIKREKVQQAFKDNNIEFVIADWTNPDPHIAALLKEHGRAGVPLYLIYPADENKQPIMLKEGIITTGDVLAGIEKLPRK